MTQLQRYLAEEIAEDHAEGHLTRGARGGEAPRVAGSDRVGVLRAAGQVRHGGSGRTPRGQQSARGAA